MCVYTWSVSGHHILPKKQFSPACLRHSHMLQLFSHIAHIIWTNDAENYQSLRVDKVPCKTGPAENERKVRRKICRKWAEQRWKISRICKHVGRKTADGVPSAKNQWKMRRNSAQNRRSVFSGCTVLGRYLGRIFIVVARWKISAFALKHLPICFPIFSFLL